MSRGSAHVHRVEHTCPNCEALSTIEIEATIATEIDIVEWRAPEVEDPHYNPVVNEVVKLVSGRFGIDPADILSDSRTPAHVRPRQLCYAAVRGLTDWSYPDIGKLFERDHSSIMNGCARAEERWPEHVDWIIDNFNRDLLPETMEVLS